MSEDYVHDFLKQIEPVADFLYKIAKEAWQYAIRLGYVKEKKISKYYKRQLKRRRLHGKFN